MERPVLAGRDTEAASEMVAQDRCAAEATEAGKFLHRYIVGFQQLPRALDPDPDQPACGCLANCLEEPAMQSPLAHGGHARHCGDCDCLLGPCLDLRQKIGELGVFAVGHRPLDILALAAIAVRWHHKTACDLIGDFGTEVAAYNMQ